MTNSESLVLSELRRIMVNGDEITLTDQYVTPIHTMNTPTMLGTLSDRVTSIADSVYGLDELAYYLDTPDTDVTPKHLRDQAYEVLAKTISFILSLPKE